MSIKELRREVRAELTRWGYPLPPFIIAQLSIKHGEAPLVVVTIASVDWCDPKKLPWKPWEIAYLKSHLDLTDREIAEKLGRSVESVRGQRVKLELRKRDA